MSVLCTSGWNLALQPLLARTSKALHAGLPRFAVRAELFFRPDDGVADAPLSASAFMPEGRLRLSGIVTSTK
jgi:hypothetical protein